MAARRGQAPAPPRDDHRPAGREQDHAPADVTTKQPARGEQHGQHEPVATPHQQATGSMPEDQRPTATTSTPAPQPGGAARRREAARPALMPASRRRRRRRRGRGAARPDLARRWPVHGGPARRCGTLPARRYPRCPVRTGSRGATARSTLAVTRTRVAAVPRFAGRPASTRRADRSRRQVELGARHRHRERTPATSSAAAAGEHRGGQRPDASSSTGGAAPALRRRPRSSVQLARADQHPALQRADRLVVVGRPRWSATGRARRRAAHRAQPVVELAAQLEDRAGVVGQRRPAARRSCDGAQHA